MTPAELALAEALLSQGLQYWAAFQARKTAGALTMADLTDAGKKLDADIEALADAIALQQATKAKP